MQDENEPLIGTLMGGGGLQPSSAGVAEEKSIYAQRLQIISGKSSIIKDTLGHAQANDLWKVFYLSAFTV